MCQMTELGHRIVTTPIHQRNDGHLEKRKKTPVQERVIFIFIYFYFYYFGQGSHVVTYSLDPLYAVRSIVSWHSIMFPLCWSGAISSPSQRHVQTGLASSANRMPRQAPRRVLGTSRPYIVLGSIFLEQDRGTYETALAGRHECSIFPGL